MKKAYILFILLFIGMALNAQDLSDFSICIDPGHGGHESDDRYIPTTGFWESESNWSKAQYLRDILESLGAFVVLTRNGNDHDINDDPSLSQRAATANQYNVDFMHSIHSNGYNGQSNYTLLLFPGPDNDPRINGLPGYPSSPIELTLSNYMVTQIKTANRTTAQYVRGDWSFYGTGQPYLGVFRTLVVPGVLSEGSFHDYIPESWRLQNLDYRRHEAWALTKSYLQLYSQPDFPFKNLAGLVRDADEGVDYFSISTVKDNRKPVNNFTVTLLPDSLVYHGDNMNNGFFVFDTVAPGEYTLIVEAEGYYGDTATVNIISNFFNFKDFFLASNRPPRVLATSPADGEVDYPAWNPTYLTFSRAMDTTGSAAKISFDPVVNFQLVWFNDNKNVRIETDTLQFETQYTVTINHDFQDSYGHYFDGNGDGVSGDDYSFQFTTSRADIFPPNIATTYPNNVAQNVELHPIVSIIFDEELDTATVNADKFKFVTSVDNIDVPATLQHYVVKNQSIVTFFPVAELQPATQYKTWIYEGVRDLVGNELPRKKSYRFTTGTETLTIKKIDDFESNLTSNWMLPSYSGSTTGTKDTTTRTEETGIVNLLTGSSTALNVQYHWDENSDSWLIREYLAGGAPRNVTFDASYIMQVYIFGDGSGNQFRFALDENYPSTAASDHEVSPWFTIDWIGWRLLSWDMTNDGTGEWLAPDGTQLGEGDLEGTLRFDSIQLTYNSENPEADLKGRLIFDDLRVVKMQPVTIAGDTEAIVQVYQLAQNFPNPFNPSTMITFSLPEPTQLRLEIYNLRGEKIRSLVDQFYPAGNWQLRWNATDEQSQKVPSGIYLYYLITPAHREMKKMMLLK
jgi:N-acetylmuramoyl-L-alanine amidase